MSTSVILPGSGIDLGIIRNCTTGLRHGAHLPAAAAISDAANRKAERGMIGYRASDPPVEPPPEVTPPAPIEEPDMPVPEQPPEPPPEVPPGTPPEVPPDQPRELPPDPER
jgi:hypothetical protein